MAETNGTGTTSEATVAEPASLVAGRVKANRTKEGLFGRIYGLCRKCKKQQFPLERETVHGKITCQVDTFPVTLTIEGVKEAASAGKVTTQMPTKGMEFGSAVAKGASATGEGDVATAIVSELMEGKD